MHFTQTHSHLFYFLQSSATVTNKKTNIYTSVFFAILWIYIYAAKV